MRHPALKPLFSFLVALALVWAGWAHAEWKEDLASPVAQPVARWVLIAGTGLTLFVVGTEDQLAGPFERSTAQHKPLGEASKYGDLLGQLVPNAAYAVGMYIAEKAGNKQGFRRASTMVIGTAYAGAVATVLKYTVREGRPYNSRVRNSFPSGHATTAFAFAGAVAAEHGWWYGVPAMGMATFVSYSRLNDHKHFLKDVVAGATIGLSCSLGVYYARESKTGDTNGVQIMPQPIPGGMELAGVWRF